MLQAEEETGGSMRRIERDDNEVGGIAADRLRSIVERFERLDQEVSGIRSDQKDILTEVSSAGFDKRVIRQLLALRRKDPKDVQEQEDLLALYRRALGC